jgi:hypothetical protein
VTRKELEVLATKWIFSTSNKGTAREKEAFIAGAMAMRDACAAICDAREEYWKKEIASDGHWNHGSGGDCADGAQGEIYEISQAIKSQGEATEDNK